MADISKDPNPALRAELQAAIDAIIPQIKGLEDLSRNEFSDQSSAAISNQLQILRRRANLLNDVVTALNAVIERGAELMDDGYPRLPEIHVPDVIISEITTFYNDIKTGVGVFVSGMNVQDQALVDAASAAVKANIATLGDVIKN
jgi:hypothetical protein